MDELVCHNTLRREVPGGCTKVLQVSWRTGQACEDLCWAITDAKEGRASEGAVPLGQGEGQWVLLLV